MALANLLSYLPHARPSLAAGHRVAFGLARKNGSVYTFLHDPTELDADEERLGSAAAMILWTQLDPWLPFETSVGKFNLLVATAMTQEEWALAKETTSLHVLYLLHFAGIGQVSDPFRESVTTRPDAMAFWPQIKKLTHDEVFDRLYPMAAREREGFEGLRNPRKLP